RSTIEYDKRGRPVSVTEGGLTRSMGYDAAGRITVLTNENGSQSTFRYDPVDRLTEQRGFDGRTQRYQYDLTGKLTQSEDEGLITLWHYDASDRITRRTVNGEPAEQWQYDDHGWLTEISHLSEGHRVAVHYGYDDKGRLTGERQTDGEDGPHPDGCYPDGRRADPPLPLRQPAPPGVPHADTAWRATGREPLPLRPAGTANGETGMAAGA
ncbi:TPA: RHS repeat protein, partial [Escherichia coli]|nr:RHS repeat protein [Escherichia coli]